jgi:hypothetical protein
MLQGWKARSTSNFNSLNSSGEIYLPGVRQRDEFRVAEAHADRTSRVSSGTSSLLPALL